MDTKEFSEDYSYVFEMGYLGPDSEAVVHYMQKAEKRRLEWKKDQEKHGMTAGPSYPHNTCIPVRGTYQTIDEQKAEAKEWRRKNYKEEQYNMPFEEYYVLPYEEKCRLEREWNLRRPKIVIKATNGTFYL